MPPLRPLYSRYISSIELLRNAFLSPNSSLHPRRIGPALSPAFQWTARRPKTSRSEAELETLLAEQAQQEREKRRPQALRWARPDRDEGIQSRYIVLIDPQTQTLSRPQPLARLLREIDRKSEFVIRVGYHGEKANQLPLCKILPKKEVFEKEQAKLRTQTDQAKARKKREGKTMELGWATAEGDLVHRFRKARQVLEAGERVNFLIENRQRRTVVPEEKARLMLDKVKAAMEEVPRVMEVGREGELGRKFKIIFGFRGEG